MEDGILAAVPARAGVSYQTNTALFFFSGGGVLIGPRVRCMSWTWFGPAYRGTSIPYS